MRVINEVLIGRFAHKHADSRRWLEEWLTVARAATWQSIHEVQATYPAADGGVLVASGAKVTVFDVSGNKYRMITDVNYAINTLAILELLTHGEYSTNRWKRRY